jgi:hypothetical protein
MTQIRKWGVRSPLGTAVGCGKMSAAGKRFAIPSVSAAARASWRLRRHNSQGRATGEPSPPATRPRRCRNPPSRHTRTHTHKPSPPHSPARPRSRAQQLLASSATLSSFIPIFTVPPKILSRLHCISLGCLFFLASAVTRSPCHVRAIRSPLIFTCKHLLRPVHCLRSVFPATPLATYLPRFFISRCLAAFDNLKINTKIKDF